MSRATNNATRDHAIMRINQHYDSKAGALVKSIGPEPKDKSFLGTVDPPAARRKDLADILEDMDYEVVPESYGRFSVYNPDDKYAYEQDRAEWQAAREALQPELDRLRSEQRKAIDRVFFWDRTELHDFLTELEQD